MNNKKLRYVFVGLVIGLVILATVNFLGNVNLDILNPKGEIASKQRDLLVFTTVLSSIVVIPVFIMTFMIAWKYKETNKKAKYTPNWDGNRALETIWWGVPIALILILSVVTWKSSHDLDPFKPIVSDKKPITIQVVALQWKWLFIYPDQDIATVNYVQFPTDTPVKFEITSDAPMNSFWIPQLGGQIYAMSGMSTQLNLMASDRGVYDGVSANISGEGFAGMKFKANASSNQEFEDWVNKTKKSGNTLGWAEYSELAKPSANDPVTLFSPVDDNLYNIVVDKYTLSDKHSGHMR